jgi:polar amino acid transport system substrate-binding protein
MIKQVIRVSLICTAFLLAACSDNSNQQTSSDAVQSKAQPEQKQAQANKLLPSAKSCQLTMGWEPWEPYHYEDQEKMVKGLDIEMMKLISQETGCGIKFKKGDWRQLLEELKSGDVDFLTGASVTNKRKEYALFSDGYRTEKFVLFVRNGESEKYAQPNLVNMVKAGFRLGITMDYIYNNEVDELQDDPELKARVFPESLGLINVSKLLDNQIDGFLEDPVVGTSAIRRQGLENQIELHPYTINTGDVHLMFSKATVNKETVDSINQALAKLRKDGRHKRLMDKYTN